MLDAFRFLQISYRWRKGTPSIENLPPDALVEITKYLTMRDMLSLRQVSKSLLKLSYTPVIWKRLLRKTNLHMTPLPPTDVHALGNLPSLSCERALRNASILEHDWNRGALAPEHNWFDSHNRTNLMSILPGGRYIVVASKDEQTRVHYMTLWDLELPNNDPNDPHRRRAALARTVIPGRVTELQTKYMQVLGHQGIVVAFVCEILNSDKPWILNVFFISMENIEEYSSYLISKEQDAKAFQEHLWDQTPPFANLAIKPTTVSISNLNLEMMRCGPLLALVRGKNEVVLQNLETQKRSFLVPSSPEEIHKAMVTRKLKLLPDQNHLFIIREVIYTTTRRSFFYELYDIPDPGATVRNPSPWEELADGTSIRMEEADIASIKFFEVSDGFTSPIVSPSAPPDIRVWAVGSAPIDGLQVPIVSLRNLRPQCQTSAREGVKEDPQRSPAFWYNPHSSRILLPHSQPVVIAGGARRALWFLPVLGGEDPALARYGKETCTVQRVSAIVRYASPKYQEGMATGGDVNSPDPQTSGSDTIPLDLPASLANDLGRGMSAHAFDEGIGRLVLATAGSSTIHILDCAGYVGIDWKPTVAEQVSQTSTTSNFPMAFF